MKAFLAKHGNGFWLHGLGAIAITLALWYWFNLPAFGMVLAIGVFIWREIKQHDGLENIFTFHRTLEWGTPLITALITWAIVRSV